MEPVIALFVLLIFFAIMGIALGSRPEFNQSKSNTVKQNNQPAPPTIVDCDFKLDFHGLDYLFDCKYYTKGEVYKSSLTHHELFEIAHVIAKDKDELLQASQFIIDKWTQMKGCRVHFGDVDLSKWNRDEMDLEKFVIKCVGDNYDDDTREWYERMGKLSDDNDDDDDDNDDDYYDEDDEDDDLDDFDDFDEDWDDDVDIDEDDEELEEEEYKDDDKEKPKEQGKKQQAKETDIKTAKHYRSILRRMANRLDAIDHEVDALCDDMESHHGNWGYYPSIRSMHENLEILRGDFSQIAEDMREV